MKNAHKILAALCFLFGAGYSATGQCNPIGSGGQWGCGWEGNADDFTLESSIVGGSVPTQYVTRLQFDFSPLFQGCGDVLVDTPLSNEQLAMLLSVKSNRSTFRLSFINLGRTCSVDGPIMHFFFN